MCGIRGIAEGLVEEFKRVLPRQRKTQRENLALLAATMLDVRSANLMDLAAALPREADRTDMRCQWISRVLGNNLIDPDAVMEPFAREVLARAAKGSEPVVLIMDQSKLSGRHQVLMLALRHGERALPLAWRVEATQGPIGFAVQKDLLEAAAPWLPGGVPVCLMADRFYGTADLISLCQGLGWDYRLRFKGTLVVADHGRKTKTGALADDRVFALQDVQLTARRATTNIGIMRDPGHNEPCEIAERFARDHRHGGQAWLPDHAGLLQALGIEPMFSDFKSRGFGIEDTQIQYPDRLARLLLVMALALYCAVSTGLWDAEHHPVPAEKTPEPTAQEGRALQNLLVHPRPAPHHQAPPSRPATTATLVNVTDGWLAETRTRSVLDYDHCQLGAVNCVIFPSLYRN